MSTKLTDKSSIKEILKELSIEEKLTLLTGSTVFQGGGNGEHGIPKPLFLDGGTGFNTMQMNMEAFFQAYEEVKGAVDPESRDSRMGGFDVTMQGASMLANAGDLEDDEKKIVIRVAEIMDAIRPADQKVGCYPPGMLFGATMNPDTIYRCGEALGREASACHIDVLLGTPNVNLHRDPRNGRLFEGYSEDPYLVSELAPNFVKGIQATGVIANVKHYAANSQETDRMGVNEIISERAMRELYLPGFEACIKAGCKTLMSAYNSINGVPCAQNSWLLRDILRDEWGFDGFVVSDWGAVYDRVEGQNAGNDVCMPGPRGVKEMLVAVKEGRLTEETINEACTNYLNVLLEMPIMKGKKFDKIDIEYSMAAAYEAAKEGITLLKNRNNILPLSKTTGVTFYGKRSKKFVECGAGSAEVATSVSTNLYDSTVAKIGADKVSFEEITANTDYVVVTVGANGQEGADRINMDLEEEDKEVAVRAIADAKAAKKPVILVLNVAGPVDLCDYMEDVDAILCVFLPGMGGGQAAADILFGDINPSGKLPLTFPKHVSDAPAYLNFPGENMTVHYGEGIYVGYRYYDKKNIEPQYPFGFGLSYTRFELSGLKVTPLVNFDKGERLNISIDVKNVGCVAGSEVVQVYIADPESTLDKPVKELKALKKVFLQPGEKTTVHFELEKKSLASYDEKLREWVTEPGIFNILVGTSSRDIKASAETTIKGLNPYGLNAMTEVAKLVVDLTAKEIVEKYLPDLNLMAALGKYVVFAPKTAFKEAWETDIAPSLTCTEAEKERIYNAIIADFEEANRNGALLKASMNAVDVVR